MRGKIFGIGVGPGDPELITLKALKILKQADLIAYPAPDYGPVSYTHLRAHET